MPRITTEALVLRRTPFGETSQVAEFLTRERGRVSLILKGVHRPKSRKGGGVDLLDLGRVTWFERRGSRSLPALVERRVICHHPGLRCREDLLQAGLVLVERLRAMLPEEQRVPEVFTLAVGALRALDARPDPAAVPAVLFSLEGGLLRMTGFEPVLDRCVQCQRRHDGHRALRCDPARGGVVCSACRTGADTTFALSSAAARTIHALSRQDPGQAPARPLERAIEADVRRFFHHTYLHVLERPPRCVVPSPSS